MPTWLENILGGIYMKIPKAWRPPLKTIFYWGLIRLQSLFLLRRFYKGKQVQFIDFEIANLEPFEFLGPAKEEVMVEAYKSVVSPGTESAVLCGLPGARRFFPYVPGYSLAGIIRKIGKNVSGFKVGDRVVGQIHHMSHETVSTNKIFHIPDEVPFEEASFMELGIITLQGIRKAGIKPGDIVAVVGQGLIGQLSNRLARMLGAAKVIAIASSRNREKTALTTDGATEYIALSENKVKVDNVKADVVIEAVGSPQAITTSMKCARDGGKVVLLGSSRGLGRDVDWKNLAQVKNLRIIGAHISALPEKDPSPARWSYRDEGELFLSLLQSKRLKVSDLVTWRAKPEECNAVYEALAEGGREHVGIMFDWKSNGQNGQD